MSQVKLTISVRKLEQEVKYNKPHQQIHWNEQSKPFLTQTLLEEVKQLPKKEKKKYAVIAKTLLLTSISTLALVNPTFAATSVETVAQQQGTIMPKDIMEIGMYLIGLCTIISTVLAIILSQLAGGYRMLRKEKEATAWTSDILKGYTQIILSPVIIVTIAFLAYLLFGGSQFFIKPF